MDLLVRPVIKDNSAT